jgi:hypothetical protein
MAQRSETKLTYIPCATTPEVELNVLAAAYRFVLHCHAKKMAARPAPEPDSCDGTTTKDDSAYVPIIR